MGDRVLFGTHLNTIFFCLRHGLSVVLMESPWYLHSPPNLAGLKIHTLSPLWQAIAEISAQLLSSYWTPWVSFIHKQPRSQPRIWREFICTFSGIFFLISRCSDWLKLCSLEHQANRITAFCSHFSHPCHVMERALRGKAVQTWISPRAFLSFQRLDSL